MRILFVLEHFYPYIGGAEHLFWELARALTAKGHNVRVVTTRFRSDLPEEETVSGISILRINCSNRFLFSFLSIPRVIREARSADLVHTTSYNAALPAFIAARLKGKPVIITFHEVWASLWWSLPHTPIWLKAGFWTWEQILLRLPFDRFVGVSRSTVAALTAAGVNPERIAMIYNGLDYSRFHANAHRPPTDFTFTYFGRLGTSKGMDFLLPAAGRFLNDHPEASFKLIIPREPAAIFQWVLNELDALNRPAQVRLMHDLDQDALFEEVATSTCIVIPSRSEGFCFVAAEAVAMGVPIVSSERTALVEVVGGQVIPIEPLSIEGVEHALEAACRADWQRKEIRQFPLMASVDHYLGMMEEIVDARKKP